MAGMRKLLDAVRPKPGIGALKSQLKEARSRGEDALRDLLPQALEIASTDVDAATLLCRALDRDVLPANEIADAFQHILDAHGQDSAVLLALGDAVEEARDLDDLNAPPPESRLFADLARLLSERLLETEDAKDQKAFAMALATTARLMARQKDDIAERAYQRVVELDPKNHDSHYNQGLFFKTRGRFAEGMAANQRGIELSNGQPSEAMQWNLGICATGAGEGAVALEVWRGIGNKVDIGREGLPDGGYPACKVRLAERPLAERTANTDDPGLEESIWVERLSPCHGIVRSVLIQDELGVDFGDMVLFDGAPITYHRYGDNTVAVFPHLATLHHGNFHFYPFAATQLERGTVDEASKAMDDRPLLYSHTENCYTLCACCWRNEGTDHAHDPTDHDVVIGRIAVPPDVSATEALARIDETFATIEGAHLIAPDLARAAGQPDRARLEEARYAELLAADDA